MENIVETKHHQGKMLHLNCKAVVRLSCYETLGDFGVAERLEKGTYGWDCPLTLVQSWLWGSQVAILQNRITGSNFFLLSKIISQIQKKQEENEFESLSSIWTLSIFYKKEQRKKTTATAKSSISLHNGWVQYWKKLSPNIL